MSLKEIICPTCGVKRLTNCKDVYAFIYEVDISENDSLKLYYQVNNKQYLLFISKDDFKKCYKTFKKDVYSMDIEKYIEKLINKSFKSCGFVNDVILKNIGDIKVYGLLDILKSWLDNDKNLDKLIFKFNVKVDWYKYTPCIATIIKIMTVKDYCGENALDLIYYIDGFGIKTKQLRLFVYKDISIQIESVEEKERASIIKKLLNNLISWNELKFVEIDFNDFKEFLITKIIIAWGNNNCKSTINHINTYNSRLAKDFLDITNEVNNEMQK